MLSKAWAMSELHLLELFQAERGARTFGFSKAAIPAGNSKICSIPIIGPISRDADPLFAMLGIQSTNSRETAAQIRAAVANKDIEQIALFVDSPGGTIDAADELAEAVYSVRGIKPIVAHADGLMASAAYWIASQADSISAERTAAIGSIGVYAVVPDSSKLLENAGITVNVLRSELKGIGVTGAKITDAQISSLQDGIDKAAGMFRIAVSRGRNMAPERVQELATGQSWFAADALSFGLIDSISTASQAPNTGNIMTQNKEDPLVANDQMHAVRLQAEQCSVKTRHCKQR
jgi:capsid assembly protease